jgi:hypothetical protein
LEFLDPARRRGRAVKKGAWLVLAGTLATALMAAHVMDLDMRARALQTFFTNKSEAMAHIAHEYGVDLFQCAAAVGDGPYALALALLTVEQLATPRAEYWLRSGLSHASAATGIALDITTGPGRIRPSTARAVLRALHEPPESLSEWNVVRRLSRTCDALGVIVAMLEQLGRREGAAPPDSTRFVFAAAAEYNGQTGRDKSPAGQLSAALYQELVYEAFQEYRFAIQAQGRRRPATKSLVGIQFLDEAPAPHEVVAHPQINTPNSRGESTPAAAGTSALTVPRRLSSRSQQNDVNRLT